MGKFSCSYQNTECLLPRIISFDVGPRTLSICTLVTHGSSETFPWGDVEIVSFEQTDVIRDHLLFDAQEGYIGEPEFFAPVVIPKNNKEKAKEARELKKQNKDLAKETLGVSAASIKTTDLGKMTIDALKRRMNRIFPEHIEIEAVVVEMQPPYLHTRKWDTLSHYIISFFYTWFRARNRPLPRFLDLFSAAHKKKIHAQRLRNFEVPLTLQPGMTAQGLVLLEAEYESQKEGILNKKIPAVPLLPVSDKSLTREEKAKGKEAAIVYENNKLAARDEMPFLLGESLRNAHLLEFFFQDVPQDNDRRDICDATLQALAYCLLKEQEKAKALKPKRKRAQPTESKPPAAKKRKIANPEIVYLD
jgi:hypothetical protein